MFSGKLVLAFGAIAAIAACGGPVHQQDGGASPGRDAAGLDLVDASELGEDAAEAGPDARGHTELLGDAGVPHEPGYRDPRNECTGCHGRILTGGDAGPSCYGCHNSSDHTENYRGNLHMPRTVDCTRCHGPTNGGGLGVACQTCHY